MFTKRTTILLSLVGVVISGICLYLFRSKEIRMVINGKPHSVSTNYIIANNFVNNYLEDDFKILTGPQLLSDKLTLEVVTMKTVKISTDGELKDVSTYALTLNELLEELNYNAAECEDYYDILNLTLDTEITDNMEIALLHKVTIEETSKKTDKVKVSYKKSSSMYIGESKTLEEGNPKVYEETHKVIYENGIEVDRILLDTNVIEKGSYKIVMKGTKPLVTVDPSSETVWDALADCESGGRWNANTGNGYYGGLQFSKRTWTRASTAVGLKIEYASQATKEEQIMAAKWLQANSGWGQWPGCSKKIGLIK